MTLARLLRSMEPPFFPYMTWAQTQSGRTPHVLSVSGLPAADPGLFADLPPIDLDHPRRTWLPEIEHRLAQRWNIDPRRVIVCLGASGGMHLAAAAWFRPGVRVVTDCPSYEPFRALPRRFGADLVVLERRLEERFALRPQAVEQAIAGARSSQAPTAAFFANPHNPSGALSSKPELEALGRAVDTLIVCEVYMEWVPEPERVHAALLAPNGVSIGSLTKAYGLGPLRAGWLILGEGLVGERERLVDLLFLDYVDPPTMSLRAYARALERLETLARPIHTLKARSRPLLERFLAGTPELEAWIPAHGFIAFPRVRGLSDTRELCERLVREHAVDVVPGHFFGAPAHIRIGCPQPPEMVAAGLERLGAGLRALTSSLAGAAPRG